jgi:hypothetical protein
MIKRLKKLNKAKSGSGSQRDLWGDCPYLRVTLLYQKMSSPIIIHAPTAIMASRG